MNMKSLMRKQAPRHALFAILLLALLLGSVSNSFTGKGGRVVLAEKPVPGYTDEVVTQEAEKNPVPDAEEETKAGEAGKIQEGNAAPEDEGENTGDPTPPPKNNSKPEAEAAGQLSSNPEPSDGDKAGGENDPSKVSPSEPAEHTEADPEKPAVNEAEISPEETGKVLSQANPTEPLNRLQTLILDESLIRGISEEGMSEALRDGNPASAFTVTKRPVGDPAATPESVGNYDTFSEAMENCAQEDLSNLYIITVNRDYTIQPSESYWRKSNVNILLCSAEGGPYSIATQSTNDFFGLDRDCKIRIKNLTLDGSKKSQFVFLTENGALTLGAGTTLQNFVDVPSTDGPAIYMVGESSLTIEPGAVIQNNESKTTGGVICGNAPTTTINIKGGRFIKNSSTRQGQSGGWGGVIATWGTLNIKGGKFEKNNATYGGAIWVGQNATNDIKNASFTENQAEQGAAVLAAGPLVMSDCTLEENKAQWGAAIFAKTNVNLNNITAKKNEATRKGGALYLKSGGTIENSTFQENKAGEQGGAIYLSDGDLTLSGSIFTENTSKFGGGALFIAYDGEGNVSVSDCHFTSNVAALDANGFGGGIYLGRNQKLKLSDSTFSKNKAAHGGAIATLASKSDSQKTNLSIQSSSFDENEAYSGGGVFTAVPTQISQSTTFNKNESMVHPDDDQTNPHLSGTGGALYVMDQQTSITGSTFFQNKAYGSGGAISINGVERDAQGNVRATKPDIMVDISQKTSFKGNTVTVGQGGAIYCAPYEYASPITKTDAYSKLQMDDSTLFLKNSSGGGLFAPPSNYQEFKNLAYSSDSDVTHGVLLTRKSVLNNYDVNFKSDVYLITYDANGGTFADDKKLQEEEHALDEKITITAAPKRAGYRFKAWQTNQTNYQPGDSYTVQGNASFVAQWDPVPQPGPNEPDQPAGEFYRLIFDPAGGHWADGSTNPRVYEVRRGVVFTIIEGSSMPGADFLYWEGSQYYPGDRYTVKGDHTFTARYSKRADGAMATDPSLNVLKVQKVQKLPRTGARSSAHVYLLSGLSLLLGGLVLAIRKK